MSVYNESLRGVVKTGTPGFGKLAIVGFLLVTLITAVLTYQIGREMAAQIVNSRGSGAVVQTDPALALPTTNPVQPTQSTVPASAAGGGNTPSNSPATSTSGSSASGNTGNKASNSAGSVAKATVKPKVNVAPPQAAQPKPVTQAS